jgi:hypothetical protein
MFGRSMSLVDMFEHPTPMNSNTPGEVPREDCENW